MRDNKDERKNQSETTEQLSLNDDRRVKVLSPGALVAKRFFRNRLAVVGLSMLIAMFLFSFVGGLISPYREDEQFYTYTYMDQEYVGVVRNNDYRYAAAEGQEFGSVLQAQFLLAQTKGNDPFTYKDVTYTVTQEGTDLYTVSQGDTILAVAYKDIVNAADDAAAEPSFNVKLEALRAYTNGAASFTADGTDYTLDSEGNILQGSTVVGYISRFVVQSKENGVVISRDFKEKLEAAIDSDVTEFVYTDDEGQEATYTITYQADTQSWSVLQSTATYVYDRYAQPSKEHWLGTDTSGMDMLTRLMYGGRISLMIGFVVIVIEIVLGIIIGGCSGYFGGWVDTLLMRVVDVVICIPAMPLYIIIGSIMDYYKVDPRLRIYALCIILGLIGWPGIARMVRGQILSLREQEFMIATEATGVRISRRIFRHLIPNVIPQLIVIATMGLGDVILMEATLSFLGIGVKFPYASWGNIVNAVNDVYVLTNFWFVWIPAGFLILITVLGFNFVGDGLRDAFDPKMKR